MKKPKITLAEKEAIIEAFNQLPEDMPARYAFIAKKLKRSTTAVFTVIKDHYKPKEEVKYFNPKIFQF